MNTNMKINLSRTLFFVLAIFASAACNAWHGHGGGYYHHGGGYYHSGGWGGGWGWGGVTVGIPLGGYYGASYYGPTCYNQRVCGYHGCWYQQRCY